MDRSRNDIGARCGPGIGTRITVSRGGGEAKLANRDQKTNAGQVRSACRIRSRAMARHDKLRLASNARRKNGTKQHDAANSNWCRCYHCHCR